MSDHPTIAATDIPWLTVDQMIEADRLAVEEFGIDLLQMMEHAGSAFAQLVSTLVPDGPVLVLAGSGNNGGGGLCAARHLHNRGRSVSVAVTDSPPGAAAAHHLATLAEIGIVPVSEPVDCAVIVDALVGYGLTGPLRGRARELASLAQDRPAIALDFPSGHGHDGAVEPMATLTLALPKEALTTVTPLYLADLGLPPELWSRMGLDVGPVFAYGRIVEIVS